MLKTYLLSPEHYYRKYVLREIETEMTASLKIGTVVDAILSGEEVRLQVKVLKKEDEGLFLAQKELTKDDLMTRKDMDKALAMAGAIARCRFWKVPRGTRELQVIYEGTIEGVLTCGKPDVLETTIDKDGVYHVLLADMKTCQFGDNENAWTWHRTCKQWGYYIQLAMYEELWRQNHPDVKEVVFTFGHITVSCNKDGVLRVQLFIISDDYIVEGMEQARAALRGIKAGIFTDVEPSWETAIMLNPKSSVLRDMSEWGSDDEDEGDDDESDDDENS